MIISVGYTVYIAKKVSLMVIEVNSINTANDNNSSPSFIDSNIADTDTAAIPFVASYSSHLDAEEAVKHWQSENPTKKLKPMHKKIAIEAFKIHYSENRGITKQDVVEKFDYSDSYAKKIIFECTSNKMLTYLEGHKQGRFKEYFLSTEIERFIEKQSSNNKQGKSLDPSQLSVIQILVNEITAREPTFHKLMIHVKMIVSDNGFDKDYNLLTAKNEWIVKSQKNKAKVKSFKLENKRSCTIQVYPNGKLIVILECSYRPFKLAEEDGCREFFETIGKVALILSQQFSQTSIIPPTGQWLLKEYDRDITIPESELSRKYPYIKQWYSQEGVQIGALGHVLQIYGKIMPICGRCLRVEEKVGIRADVLLEQGIKEATEQQFGIVSAFELLTKESDSGSNG
jgi:hypothetical protein